MRVWFTSCVGVDFSPEILPHFLRHYLGLGVAPERFLLVLNSGRFGRGAIRAATAVVRSFDLPEPAIWRGKYTSEEKQRRVRDVLDANVEPDDWVVHADSDEMQEYPAPLGDVIDGLVARDENVMKGLLLDRIAADGGLPPVRPAPPLEEQYPVVCHVGPEILGLKQDESGGKRKLMLYRGDLRPNRGSGTVDEEFESRARVTGTEGRIHHYKWTSDVLDKLRDRARRYRKLGFGWWRQSQSFLDYWERHGRIRREDVRVVDP